jgi:hypothetical protein
LFEKHHEMKIQEFFVGIQKFEEKKLTTVPSSDPWSGFRSWCQQKSRNWLP